MLLRFRAALNTSLPNGAVVTNTGVVTWNNPSQTASASASIVVGSIPGTLPSLFAEKRVTLFVNLGSPGIVDPGDTLRYTITTENSGAYAATGVVLRDTVPANTTYVANSRCSTGLLSDSRTAASRRSPRALTPARSRRGPRRPFSSTCASTPVRPPEP